MAQTYENHARVIPAYHIVAFGALAINLLWSVYVVVTSFSAVALVGLLLAVALIIMFFFARIFALTVQDRVIRLEMHLRMRDLLPADLGPRIGEFTVDQLVALRFASDEELPQLARQVLDERLTDRRTIKKRIRVWKPDYLRA